MMEIRLNAANWTAVIDFYDAILKGIGAPEWHGESIDGLIDSMIWGGINKVNPPYTVTVFNTKNISSDIRDEMADASLCLAKARRDFRAQKNRDVEVSLEIVS